MIRILHTADWHLGQTLAGYSRDSEHRATLAALVALAVEEEVDAVIVAGDVFDTLNPSAEAQALYFETLARLRAARPHAAIVVVAGNHDPAGRLEAPRALYGLVGVHVVGTIARDGAGYDLSRHLVPVRDASGRIGAHVLAAPFPRAADLPPLDAATEGSPVVAGVRSLYAGMIAQAGEAAGGTPLVVTGHLHVAGGLESEGAERRILVGGEHAAPPDIFPPEAAYVALGHLHRPQSVGRETIRYSGSLFPLSKTEIGYDHGATIVTIENGRVGVAHRPIARPVANLRLQPLAPGEVEGALAALALDEATPFETRPFLYLTIRIDGPATGVQAEVAEIAGRFPVRLVSVALERPAREGGAAPEPVIARLAERAPVEVFREAFLARHGVEPSPDHLSAFDALLVAPERD